MTEFKDSSKLIYYIERQEVARITFVATFLSNLQSVYEISLNILCKIRSESKLAHLMGDYNINIRRQRLANF